MSQRIASDAWERAREAVAKEVLRQLLVDRSLGRPVQLEHGGLFVPSASLTLDDLTKAARARATEIQRRKMRRIGVS